MLIGSMVGIVEGNYGSKSVLTYEALTKTALIGDTVVLIRDVGVFGVTEDRKKICVERGNTGHVISTGLISKDIGIFVKLDAAYIIAVRECLRHNAPGVGDLAKCRHEASSPLAGTVKSGEINGSYKIGSANVGSGIAGNSDRNQRGICLQKLVEVGMIKLNGCSNCLRCTIPNRVIAPDNLLYAKRSGIDVPLFGYESIGVDRVVTLMLILDLEGSGGFVLTGLYSLGAIGISSLDNLRKIGDHRIDLFTCEQIHESGGSALLGLFVLVRPGEIFNLISVFFNVYVNGALTDLGTVFKNSTLVNATVCNVLYGEGLLVAERNTILCPRIRAVFRSGNCYANGTFFAVINLLNVIGRGNGHGLFSICADEGEPDYHRNREKQQNEDRS